MSLSTLLIDSFSPKTKWHSNEQKYEVIDFTLYFVCKMSKPPRHVLEKRKRSRSVHQMRVADVAVGIMRKILWPTVTVNKWHLYKVTRISHTRMINANWVLKLNVCPQPAIMVGLRTKFKWVTAQPTLQLVILHSYNSDNFPENVKKKIILKSPAIIYNGIQ